MSKKILYYAMIAIIFTMGACSNDELLNTIPTENTEGLLQTERTVSFTATLPNNDDVPGTRVSLTEEGKNIKLLWIEGDVIELAFTQEGWDEEIIALSNYQLKSTDILNGGKNAKFNLTIPDVIDPDELFDLYGVYGGGGLIVKSAGENPGPMSVHVRGSSSNLLAIMPKNPGSATSLNDLNSPSSIENRKDVMLYFSSQDLSAATPQVAKFIHLGSLFSITLKNTSAIPLNNLTEARLVGIGGYGTWACNVGDGGGLFNVPEEGFYEAANLGNYISFKAPTESLAPNTSITFWGWYPPNPQEVSPELKLELKATNTYTSFNTKPKRTQANTAVAGKSYAFFAIWDGTKLEISNREFEPLPGLYVHDVATDGQINALSDSDKASITAMKVTGLINNEDFQVMKSQMPQLRYLDLLDATCVNNEIPSKAFGDDVFGKALNSRAVNTPNTTLVTLTLPHSITSIGSHAFHGCSGLSGSLIIPNGVTSIGEFAFSGCYGFTGDLIIPNSVTTIGKSAFDGCYGFDGNLSLSDLLETIEESAFSNNNFIGHLSIPANVTTIEKYAFIDCNGFTGLTLPNGLKSIGESSFWGCHSFSGNLLLPSTLISIEEGAFGNCGGFTGDLTIPDGITVIESQTFSYCSGLDGDLNLPSGLKSIKQRAFEKCYNLSGGLSIPDKLTIIEEAAFSYCASFTGPLTIPNSVTTMGENAFDKCVGFDGTLTLSTNLKTIERSTFFGCDGLKGDLTISEGITAIEMFAFEGCTGLNGKVILPTTLASIKHMAFEKCTNVSAFRFLRHTPIEYFVKHWSGIGTGGFIPPNASIEVPEDAVAAYKSKTGWVQHFITGF